MKVLVVGGGGREHALAWKLRQSRLVEHVWCAPGNGGISQDAECVSVDVNDVAALVELGERLKPDVTVVGPELPLVLGVVDEFSRHGLRVVGPSKQAAEIEGSKVFAKEFLERHRIPTASAYGVYESAGDAYSALCAVDWPVVIKADGLCGGKGVLVGNTPDEATAFIERLMEKGEFGASGRRVLLEEALEGDELSYIVLTDGERIAPMAPTRDHKRLLDGNQGPNTGGMGALSSDGLVSRDLDVRILKTIVEPTIRGLAEEGRLYRGFLYFGLMVTSDGPDVLEFNCRMGDPEAQALAVRMDFDLAEVLQAVIDGNLASVRVSWKRGGSVCVVMASGGYPGDFQTGKVISGLAEAQSMPGVVVFHAATKKKGSNYCTSGGRILGVTAAGPNLESAIKSVYDAVGGIEFEGAHFRSDIGAKELAKGRTVGE